MNSVAPISVQGTQVVDTRYTQDVLPVLDTGKFEHMQRIACVMARSSIIPDSLRKGKNDEGKDCWLPEEVVIANCFRIVNQAVRWGMDPFAVADCASIVHGRLMWEGKLVAAVIDAKLGIRLGFAFTNDTAARKADDQTLGVVVSGQFPDEAEPRTIEGRVVDWHKGPKSPWGAPSAWKRQLRYMGAREWARAHAPAILLGVYTDDEIDAIVARDVPAGQRALRMKDVTPDAPKLPALAIPDVPDEAPPAATPATAAKESQAPESDDEPIADAEGYIKKLADDIALCDSAEELAEISESNADMIARLPKAQKLKALNMLKDAAE